ncbi:cytidylyltransferase domain-containing protein [Algoriphagus sanaruensis]|uniref:CMP-N-acetylneuraminic acid synthetase n=1 Tax=Algoriphagus sanaruensis TaxID=1727163 RepID=A0A142EQX0_9BACT|nr:acylneuraminate cytidylyltransferase family protein [Algoriphagus sanaruensis]AMQ57525.1 CMP-N-acetylneuraminic acid synthetase [Algoriphagus sanaruensis]
MITDTLFIIPARGGSKGLPRKNILPINGKPMICYTIDAARGVTSDENICISTDDLEIKKVVEDYGLNVHFLRPAELATDTSGTREVLLHALEFYQNELMRNYSKICLLQPTSPLRTSHHIQEAYQLWSDDLDMVVSVKESKSNPYFNLYEEQPNGFLRKSKDGNYERRQDSPKIWEFNGAIYFIKTQSIQSIQIIEFKKIEKYIMNEEDSVDVDNMIDFKLINFLIE